jgi:hypothetical protein
MYYLSNFARTKGAKDRQKRKRKNPLLNATRDAILATSITSPAFYTNAKRNIDSDVQNAFLYRNVDNAISKSKGLEKEFADIFLTSPNLENVRKDYLDIKKKESLKGLKKKALIKSLPITLGVGLGSLYLRSVKNAIEEQKLRKNKKKNQSTKSDKK